MAHLYLLFDRMDTGSPVFADSRERGPIKARSPLNFVARLCGKHNIHAKKLYVLYFGTHLSFFVTMTLIIFYPLLIQNREIADALV